MAVHRSETKCLEPYERRIALMHVAGASDMVIAGATEINPEQVRNVLKRPRVARFVLLLHGIASDGLEEGIADLNAAFKEKAKRAFELEAMEMEALHDMGLDEGVKPSTRIRAKLGVAFTARDILDRAGYRAPQKVYNYGSGTIPVEVASAMVDAANELASLRRAERAIDVTPAEVERIDDTTDNT